MTDNPNRGSRLRLLRDVAVFQVKLVAEAVLDITLIPVSPAAVAREPARRPCVVSTRSVWALLAQ
jgi:hypothetical protein